MKIPYFCAIKRSHRSQATAQASVGMTWLLRAPASVGMTWLLQAINNNAAAVVRQPYKSRQHELNPESWTKNFRGFIMRKKHDYEARLKYMKMLEEGHSVSSISRQYGIDHRILSTLWMRYKEEGPVALVKKKNCTFTVAEKIAVISEYREKHLSLPDIMLSHGVSRSAIKGWCRRYAAGGEEALVDRPRGRRREDMGRPKKKKHSSNGVGIDDVVVTKTTANDWIVVPNVTSPYTLTNLEQNTPYEWQVQGIVPARDGSTTTTEWSDIQRATTGTLASGNTEITLAVTGYDNDGGWVFISSPVSGSIPTDNVINLIGAQIQNNPVQYNYDLYRFNDSVDLEWQNYHQHYEDETYPFNALVNGHGYLYASKYDRTLVFTGTFNQQNDTTVTLDYTTGQPFAGWNLVGNPFADSATLTKAYYRMNAQGSALNTSTESTKIAAMEGVFVQATAANQTVIFTATAQTRGSEQAAIPQANIMVIGDNGAVLDNAILRFDDGQTLEKFSLRKGSTKIYFPQGGTDYAIACAESTGEMPVNFKASENGTYTISVNPEGVELGYLHLIDNLTGADVDLLAGCGDARHCVSTYTFTAKTTDYASRFRLVFSTVSEDADGDEDAPFAFVSNGNIIVNGEGMLQIVDMMGRVIRSTDVTCNISTTGITPGIYVLRLIDGDTIRVQKIVVQTQP